MAVFGILASPHAHALWAFIASSLAVGLAQGVASTAVIKTLLATTTAQERAGLLSTIYLVSYCGVALPGLAAGQLARRLDLLQVGEAYATLALVTCALAVVAMRNRRVPAGSGIADPTCSGSRESARRGVLDVRFRVECLWQFLAGSGNSGLAQCHAAGRPAALHITLRRRS